MCGLSTLESFYFETFSRCVTIVVPSLVCINIDSFGVIICYNLVTGNTPKIFFHCLLEMKIRPSWRYVLHSKSETREPIWPTYCEIVFLPNRVCEFWFLFSFSSRLIGSTNDLLSLISTAYNKRTNALDKNLRHGFLVKPVRKRKRS